MNSQLLSLLGILGAKAPAATTEGSKNQSVKAGEGASVFRDLLALQGVSKAGTAPLVERQSLPLSGKGLPNLGVLASNASVDQALLSGMNVSAEIDVDSVIAMLQQLGVSDPEAALQFITAAQQSTALTPAALTRVEVGGTVSVQPTFTMSESTGRAIWSDDQLAQAAAELGISPGVIRTILNGSESMETTAEKADPSRLPAVSASPQLAKDGVIEISVSDAERTQSGIADPTKLARSESMPQAQMDLAAAEADRLDADVAQPVQSSRDVQIERLVQQLSGQALPRVSNGNAAPSLLNDEVQQTRATPPVDSVLQGARPEGRPDAMPRPVWNSTSIDPRVNIATNPRELASQITTPRPLIQDRDVLEFARDKTTQDIVRATEARLVSLQASEPKLGVSQSLAQQSSITSTQSTRIAEKAITAEDFLKNRSKVNLRVGQVSGGAETPKAQADGVRTEMPARLATLDFLGQKAFTQKLMQGRAAADLKVTTPQPQGRVAQAPEMSPNSLATDSSATTAVETDRPQVQLMEGARGSLVTQQNMSQIQKAMGNQVMKMIENGKWDAEMELNPARLGKIRVRMSMESNELQLTLASQNTAVRDLLEASLPRLRDGFVDSGIQLTQTNIQQDLSGGQQRGANGASDQQGSAQQQARREASTGNGASEGQNAETRSNHDGELDLFA